jgi:CheY-like chemotaxis protein
MHRGIYKKHEVIMNSFPSAAEKSDSHFAEQHPLRILVTDDNYINRRLLLLQLRNLGYDADARETGRECLETVLADPEGYDLLLSDIDMPEMDGIECAKAIRDAGSPCPLSR